MHLLSFLRTEGSALISALFIMTLVAIAATAMSMRLQLDIYRTNMILLSDKLYLASQGVTFWAISALKNKANNFLVSSPEGMVLRPPISFNNLYPQVQIEGGIYDLQARFNLNSLASKEYYATFVNLLTKEIGESQKADEIATATQLWISPFKPTPKMQANLQYYLQENPPYYPSHQFFTSLSEFRLVRNVTAPLYQKLHPYLIALPENTPININTASPVLLASLGNGLTPEEVHTLLTARGKTGIATPEAMSKIVEKINLNDAICTIESHYFLALSIVHAGELSVRNYTILQRVKDKNKNWQVNIIADSMNTL